jgi:phytoene synthase
MPSEPKREEMQERVRLTDYDRFLSALLARSERRPHLMALYAFNHEIAKTAEAVSQPALGLIRLQWWREAIAEIYEGRVREHEIAQAFARTVGAHDLPRDLIEAMIEAREADLEETPFADMAAMEAYADATSGNVMRLAARILGAGEMLDEAARDAGIAYALTGLLRALPFRAARRNLVLPLTMLDEAGIPADDVFAGSASVAPIVLRIADRALVHYRVAQAHRIPRAVLPALLPAALTPLYARVVTRAGFDPFRHATDVSGVRRQFAMLAAMCRGRI